MRVVTISIYGMLFPAGWFTYISFRRDDLLRDWLIFFCDCYWCGADETSRFLQESGRPPAWLTNLFGILTLAGPTRLPDSSRNRDDLLRDWLNLFLWLLLMRGRRDFPIPLGIGTTSCVTDYIFLESLLLRGRRDFPIPPGIGTTSCVIN